MPKNLRHTFCFWGTRVKTRRIWDTAGREWILGRVWRGDAGETMKLVSKWQVIRESQGPDRDEEGWH